MPIGYPGNSVTKTARAKAGGGFESAIEEVVSGTPAISVVSGAFTAGQTITVTGSGFGSRPTAAPAIYEDFAGATEGQLLTNYDPSWVAYSGGTVGAELTTSDSVEGGACARNTTARDEFDTNHKSFPQADKAFFSYFWKIKGAVVGDSSSVVKLGRITSSTSAGGGGVYNGVGATALSNLNPFGPDDPSFLMTTGNNVLSRTTGLTNRAYISVPLDTWVRIDHEIVLSTPGAADGFIGMESVGIERETWPDILTRESGFSFQMDTVLLGLMPANLTGTGFELLTDIVYADNTFARVEIGDNSVFTSCTYRRILPTTAWADGEISALVPHTVPSGTYYVFVVTDDRALSTGYEVTV